MAGFVQDTHSQARGIWSWMGCPSPRRSALGATAKRRLFVAGARSWPPAWPRGLETPSWVQGCGAVRSSWRRRPVSMTRASESPVHGPARVVLPDARAGRCQRGVKSVGEVRVGHDVVRRDPYQQLAGLRVALAVLLGPLRTHVAARD